MHRTVAEWWCLIAIKKSLVRLPDLVERNVLTQKIYMSYCGTLIDDSELSYMSGCWGIGHHGCYQKYLILTENVF